MASSIGNLSVNLALESAQFISGLRRAAAQTEATGAQISKMLNGAKAIGSTLAAAFAVDWLRGQVQSAFDYADAIADVSAATGASTKFLQEFRYAAQMSGSSVEGADAAIGKFSKNLGEAANGNQGMIKSMRDLGVTSNDVDTAIKQAADGIAKLPTPAQRSAAAVSLFGKSAQELGPLLSQGSRGLNELARAADELGVVLDGDLINNAGQVNDKLDAMSMIVTAQFANVIIQNADAIASLTNSIAGLVTSLIQFWGQNPSKAMGIMGGLGGAAVGARVGGPWGAAIGGAIGFVGGKVMGENVEDGQRAISMDPTVRAQEMQKARKAYLDAKAGKGQAGWGTGGGLGAPDVKGTAKEFLKQMSLLDQALHPKPKPDGAPGGAAGSIPGVKPSGGGASKKSPDRSAENIARASQQFVDDLERADIDLLSAKRDAAVEVLERSALEREIADKRHQRELRQIDQDTGSDVQIAAGKAKYTKAQADELKAKLMAVKMADYDAINSKENGALDREVLTSTQTLLEIKRNELEDELALARGRATRNRIQKQIIDNEGKAERLSLEAITNPDSNATTAERKDAQAWLDALPRATQARKDAADRSNLRPGAAFLDSIPKSAEEINDALEAVEADGLQSLQDGLKDVITGAGSVGDAFTSMANTIIDGLIKIGLQQAIIAPLGNALFGAAGGTGGGIFGGLFGKRANGGWTAPGTYLVGERGPELVNIGRNANVTNTRQLGVAGGGSSGGVNVTFGSIVSNDPAMVKALAMQAAAEMAPVFRGQTVDATMAKFRRPTM